MELSLRRWKPGQLLASWGAYWAGLVAVGLGPGLLASWRATRLPDGHGTIQAGFDKGMLSLSVLEQGVKTFDATTAFSTAMLWVIGPPLALWVMWLIVRRRHGDTQRAVGGTAAAEALPAGSGPASQINVRGDERAPARREPPR